MLILIGCLKRMVFLMSNYSRGANFERRVQKLLEDDDWLVIRSAGSHGPVDLVAFRKGLTTRFIQCKISKEDMTRVEKRQLAELAGEHKACAWLYWREGKVVFNHELDMKSH